MQFENALAREKSPYLLQHAHNPVHWLPWGEEAFAIARREDKPVLVSIGYSTCHWCHVMERESFEDEDIAALLNDAFVCVKVDREERPDVDSVYMNVCHLLTGSGGWPLNVVLTPDKKPFFAATYIPPTSRQGRSGLDELVPRIIHIWKNEREKILESSQRITAALSDMERQDSDPEALDAELSSRLVHGSLSSTFDEEWGGFGTAPKFPSAHTLLFLLQHNRRTGNENSLRMATETLRAMRAGGIWDHVGFGFHRYSTDARWLLPHFEKMLYDQAMLALAFLEAFQLTNDTEFADTARRIFEYVLRDMRSPDGGFYTAEDADSEGEEGLFHTWTRDDIHDALSAQEAAQVCEHYNIRPEGNFHDEATGRLTGRNIPHEIASGSLPSEKLDTLRKKLFAVREKRIRPHLDDKILTDLNGMMIAALARGGRVLKDDSLVKAAQKAAEFISSTLVSKDGKLIHGYRNGAMNAPGTLDDYAFLLWGLLELHDATFDSGWLKMAEAIATTMLGEFEDTENGGFYLTPESGETILVRQKPGYDGAIPSGNSVAVYVLTRLGRLLDRPNLVETATRCTAAHSQTLRHQPLGLVHMVSGLDILHSPPESVVVAGPKNAPETQVLLNVLLTSYRPGLTMRFVETDTSSKEAKASEYVQGLKIMKATAGAWLCQNYRCEEPITAPELLKKALG